MWVCHWGASTQSEEINISGIFCHLGEAARSLALCSREPVIMIASYVGNNTQAAVLLQLALGNAHAILRCIYSQEKKGKCVRMNYAYA